MKCPFCSHVETQVMETRMSEEGDSIRRRRSCRRAEAGSRRVVRYPRRFAPDAKIARAD